MRILALFLLFCLYNLNSSAVYQNEGHYDPINDGPYVFYVNDSLRVKMIENNVLSEYYITAENYPEIKTAVHLSCEYNDLLSVYSQKIDYSQDYPEVDSIIAISDVHGQYRKYTDILKANGIIDNDLNWNFGKGHLVFLGDAFDRGDMVTELLWHLFTLEKQAEKAGGMVHILPGNHDDMALNGDQRYMNEKYRKVEALTQTRYSDLYSGNSVLGKWLRNKPVMITINEMTFVHGGISIDMVRMKIPVKQANKLFSGKIIGKELAADNKNKQVELLAGDNGPLWYRGYFEDSTFCESRLDSILNFYQSKQIIVGHTTFKKIKGLYKNRIVGIDAGLGYNQPGEVLIYKEGNFYSGSITGQRTIL
ncbi:MAG: metallophosphoesterase [Lentimicrobium sp.]|nr:metallophosphoesterase [Lentimicrobium sp.]